MATDLLILPTEDHIKRLVEDPEKFEHLLSLFQEWLRYQKHLPQSYSKTILSLYLRSCKMDLKKAKDKFETFCYLSQTHGIFVGNRVKTLERDVGHLDYMLILPLPVGTSEGCRISVVKLQNGDKFDVLSTARCASLLIEYRIHHEVFIAGEILIFDLDLIKPHHYPKLFTPLLLSYLKISIKAYPARVQQIFIFPCHQLLEKGVNLCKTVLPEKIANRIHLLKDSSELRKHLPEKCLPSDYGGAQPLLADLITKWKELLLRESEFFKYTNEIIPIGPLPKHIIKFNEDMGADGSFRKLTID